jgi:hypothetical protein
MLVFCSCNFPAFRRLLGNMNAPIEFRRRIGPSPRASACYSTAACPDIFELADGDFAIIGSDITHMAAGLPSDAGCAPHERIIRIPRKLLVQAKADIPDQL